LKLLEKTLSKIESQDANARNQARARLEQLVMPHWALGRMMDLGIELAGMTGSIRPPVKRKTIVVMAGDHGVVDEGVSRYPAEVTAQMVKGFARGGAAINILAKQSGAEVVVVDMGVAADLSELVEQGAILSKKIGFGTKNIARGPAMSRGEAIRSVEAGIEIACEIGNSVDVFGMGEMGIGNTTPSSALVAVMSALPVQEVTGRGTGIDDAMWKKKITVIEKALACNQPNPKDGLDLLEKLGGYEIGGLAGLCLGAAAMRKPVVVDGFISTAGAMIAHLLEPKSREYMLCAHKSVEPGHRISLEWLGRVPFLDLGFRLGEGTGAAVAMNIIDGAAMILKEMATFEEIGVSGAV
jgi:nicotinate-nucleotide--dimethylbenzimidazole phosphoribosyltransferase